MSQLYKECRSLIKNYKELDVKDKTKFSKLFLDLIKSNKNEAMDIYKDFMFEFDSCKTLELSKNQLEEACGTLKDFYRSEKVDINLQVCELLLEKKTQFSELEQYDFANHFLSLIKKDLFLAAKTFKKNPKFFLKEDFLESAIKAFLKKYEEYFKNKGEEAKYKREFYEPYVAMPIRELLEEYITDKTSNKNEQASDECSLSPREKKMVELFKTLCTNAPKIAYHFSVDKKNAEKIESVGVIDGIRRENWKKLKEAKEKFNIDDCKTDKDSAEKIKGTELTYYLKLQDYLTDEELKTSINLLFIGQKKSGKTTTINSLTNYLCGVEYDDTIRLRLIKEKKQAQTEKITIYGLRATKNGSSVAVRFIDTPGFENAGAIDKETAGKVSDFLEKECPRISGICFVMKSTDNRITPTQKYIADKILRLFGNDIKQNLFGLLTFSDGSEPEVIAAMKESKMPIEDKNIFCFNNSGITPKSNPVWMKGESEPMKEMHFKSAYKCFEEFFDSLKGVPPVEPGDAIKSKKEKGNRISSLIEGIEDSIRK